MKGLGLIQDKGLKLEFKMEGIVLQVRNELRERLNLAKVLESKDLLWVQVINIIVVFDL